MAKGRAAAVRVWVFRVSALSLLFACPRVGAEEEEDTADADEEDAPANADQRLDQLGRSDLQALCRDLNLELSTRFSNRRLVTYECTRLYIERGDSLSCNQGVNDCLLGSQTSAAAPRGADFQIDQAECAAIGACRLSVGEFDTCIGDRFDQSDQLMARISCSLANDPEAVDAALRAADAQRQVPRSCVAVASVCPELL
ncbi:MAG: hypothetical protein RL033_4251 [Pseudomonadota bacterium]